MKKLLAIFLFWAIFLSIPFVFADDVIVGGEPHKKTEMIIYDDAIAATGFEYFGWALPGTDTGATTWKMMRITYVGNDFTLEWADGNKNYDNEWDDRVAPATAYE